MRISIDVLKGRLFCIFLVLLVMIYFSGIFTVLSFADELLLIIAFIYILFEVFILKVSSRFSIFTIMYLIYAVLIASFSPFDPNIAYSFLQSLIHIKVLVIAYFAISTFGRGSSGRLFLILFKVLIFLYFSTLSMNFLIGEAWNNFVGFHEQQYRYGFLRPAGIFAHYGTNSYFFTLMVTTLLLTFGSSKAEVFSYHLKKFILFVFIDFLAAFPLTVRKGILILIPYLFYVIGILKPKFKALVMMLLIIFIFILLWFISDTTIYLDTVDNLSKFFSDDHTYLRGIIVYHGFALFSDFFPVGVGAGLYGTVFSTLNTSVYDYIELNKSLFNDSEGKLIGIYDSGLASLAAEMGFIGLLFILYLTYLLVGLCSKLTSVGNLKIIKLLTFYMLLLLVTEPVFQNGFFTIFYCMAVLYVILHGRKESQLER